MEVGFRMILLEGSGSISMPIYISIGLVLFGLFALWQGVRIRREPIPRFVLYYRGWSSIALTMPYGGVFLITLGLGPLLPYLPLALGLLIWFVWVFSGVIFLVGIFIWFPWFLTPKWYRRARKAGVPRHDQPLWGTSKLYRWMNRNVSRSPDLDLKRLFTSTSGECKIPCQIPVA